MSAARLPRGGRVDRSRTLSFTFDGRPCSGLAGDTLASALLANGVSLVGRSFKYHRPRGILSAGPEEPNALVELRTQARREPNTRATQVELFEGLTATSQNRWPTLALDARAVNGWFAPLLHAGFYYKTFMWPARFWERVYEPLIRRAAGLGRASGETDPDDYEKCTLHADVLVIGSGPAGLAAARAAALGGARVVLCEQDFDFGGRLLSEATADASAQAGPAAAGPALQVDGQPAAAWAQQVVSELRAMPDVTLLPRTTVFGAFDHGQYAAVERVWDHALEPAPFEPRQRLWRIVARTCVMATGALERPLVFDHNDRPGVMLAGAVHSYVNRFGVLPGREAVVFATHDDAAHAVHALARAGARVAAVVDPRPASSPALRHAAEVAGARLLAGTVVERAVAAGWPALAGAGQVRAVQLRGPSGTLRLDCDLLAMGGGFTPTLHLSSHTGHKPRWDADCAAFVPAGLPAGMHAAGAVTGGGTLVQCLTQGTAAGLAALREMGLGAPEVRVPEGSDEAGSLTPLWRVSGAGAKAFVDFQHDVTADDLALAAREGFKRPELMKRYTTLGMGTDQGKTSGMNGLGIMGELLGREVPSLGTTTFRPPYTPVALGAFVGHGRGRHFRPTRLAPTHAWSRERGAVFVEAGAWLRAQYYPRAGESGWLEAATREARAVRERVGFCDVSTLGKVELTGADVGTFLDLVYANRFSNLAVGRARYGLMLREDGIVLDDGTTARLGEQLWILTTTTANAPRVMQHLEHARQVLWPELDVRMASVTDQWGQVALAGPRAHEVLAQLVDPEVDISERALPYMGAIQARLHGGVPARLFRISFSGELGYEIAVPAAWAHALMQRIEQAGAAFGIEPYGTEALTMLRVEKGHAAGGELNGQTSAADLGLARMLSPHKHFIGKALSQRAAFVDPRRPTLVGLRPVQANGRAGGGAHLFEPGAPRDIAHDLGYLTSATYSPALGQWVALGLLASGRSRIGSRVIAHDPVRGQDTEMWVTEPCMVDPEGTRLKVTTPARDGTSGGTLAPPAPMPPSRHALHGVAQPGRHGRTQGPAGVQAWPDSASDLAHVLPAPGQRAMCMQALAGAFGPAFALDEPRRAVRTEALGWHWCGPDRWLACAPAGSPLGARLHEVLSEVLGQTAGVIDQGSGLHALRLSGPAVRRTLAKGLSLDLHPRAFVIGETALTLLAHQHVQLTRCGPDDFELVAPRSTASDLWDWLLASAGEFGLEVLEERQPANPVQTRRH